MNHDGSDYFTVKIVDGGTPEGNGDVIAVLASQEGFGNWLTSPDPTPSRDYPMDAAHAGIVTGGNLVIHSATPHHQLLGVLPPNGGHRAYLPTC